MQDIFVGLSLIINISLSYFLKNHIYDLLLRFFQNLIRPIELIINYLKSTNSSIILLNYRKKLLNFLLVIVALIMLISEFGTLKEIILAFVPKESAEAKINFGYISVNIGTLASIAYITIATILGFFALELLEFKKIFQGILYNDLDENLNKNNIENFKLFKIIIASIFLIGLLVLAFYQGKLAIVRFVLSSETKDPNFNLYGKILKAFYFLLGFLTPIIASIALLSFDIFLAIILDFLILILNLIIKIISAIYYALESIIELISLPFVKILELFGIYQNENINNQNKDKVKPAIRLAPLINNNEIYFLNKSNFLHNYNLQSKFFIISNNPNLTFSIPNNEFKINRNTTFLNLEEYIKQKFYLNNKEINYFYVDINGLLNKINKNDLLINYLKITNSIYLNIDIKK